MVTSNLNLLPRIIGHCAETTVSAQCHNAAYAGVCCIILSDQVLAFYYRLSYEACLTLLPKPAH